MLRVVEAGVCAGGEQRSADLIAIRGGFWGRAACWDIVSVGKGQRAQRVPRGWGGGYLRALKNCFPFNRDGGDDSVFLSTWFIF